MVSLMVSDPRVETVSLAGRPSLCRCSSVAASGSQRSRCLEDVDKRFNLLSQSSAVPFHSLLHRAASSFLVQGFDVKGKKAI